MLKEEGEILTRVKNKSDGEMKIEDYIEEMEYIVEKKLAMFRQLQEFSTDITQIKQLLKEEEEAAKEVVDD